MFVLANQGMIVRPFDFTIFADSVKQSTKFSILYDGVRLREDRAVPVNPYFLIELSIVPKQGQMSTPKGAVATTYPSLRWNVVFGL